MLKLVMMITIIKRNMSENLISFFNNNGVPMTLGRYGRGTATDETLNYLGIAEKEKCITFCLLPINQAKSISKVMNKTFNDFYSFAIPISSIGGKKIMEHLSGNSKNEDTTSNNTNDTTKFTDELIIIITNRGYVDNVMDIARKAGAPGGTVIHARGTGVGDSEKFFGVTVGAEKEMIFIVTEKEKRDNIMQSIMESAGTKTPAGSILFSLPVTKLDYKI